MVTLEFLALGAMAIFASPLVGFMLFFCGMHGARHIVRTVNRTKGAALGAVLNAAIVPMLIVASVVALLLITTREQSLEIRVIRLIFVGLASLTVPHMLLVEPLRFRDWQIHDQ